MKRLSFIILVFIFTFVCCFGINEAIEKLNVSSNRIMSKYTVVIDPGHGGRDAGAIGVDGSKEKDINLDIALILYDYLMVSGINAVLTRDTDIETYYKPTDDRNKSDLYNRIDLVNSISNSALISIHQNHFDTETEWGTQIWYSANTPQSEQIANSILTTVKEFLQKDNKRENKVSDDSYYLLYKASVPSVMVECGFVSNIEENKRLQSTEYQNDMAFSILVGVSEVV